MPALKVLSTILPERTFLMVNCTKAGPLPGLDVLELDDGPQLAIEVQDGTVLDVIGSLCQINSPISSSNRESLKRALLIMPRCAYFVGKPSI